MMVARMWGEWLGEARPEEEGWDWREVGVEKADECWERVGERRSNILSGFGVVVVTWRVGVAASSTPGRVPRGSDWNRECGPGSGAAGLSEVVGVMDSRARARAISSSKRSICSERYRAVCWSPRDDVVELTEGPSYESTAADRLSSPARTTGEAEEGRGEVDAVRVGLDDGEGPPVASSCAACRLEISARSCSGESSAASDAGGVESRAAACLADALRAEFRVAATDAEGDAEEATTGEGWAESGATAAEAEVVTTEDLMGGLVLEAAAAEPREG